MKYITFLLLIFLSCSEEPFEILESNELIIVSSSFEDYEKVTIDIRLQCPGCFLETSDKLNFQVIDQDNASLVYEDEHSLTPWRCIDNNQGDLSFFLSSDDIPPAGNYEIVVSIELLQNNCTDDLSAIGKHVFRYLL